MKKVNHLKIEIRRINIMLLAVTLLFLGCKKDTNDDNNEPAKTYTITVGVYILSGTSYVDQNKDLIFNTQEACQSWSRTSQSDNHSTSSHNHFNAARNTSYDATTETITWTEFGPELDQTSIDNTCNANSGGTVKSADMTNYSIDKNFYLKIKSVVEN